jgi:hypothetical protein
MFIQFSILGSSDLQIGSPIYFDISYSGVNFIHLTLLSISSILA